MAAISEQLKHDSASRRLVVEEGHQQAQYATPGEFEVGSSRDLQANFRSIRDRVAKIKLPADLVVGDSRTGVGKNDWPKFQTIQRCARFQETTLKVLSQCTGADSESVIADVTTIALAQLRFLQEEYTNLLVANQFDDGTTGAVK